MMAKGFKDASTDLSQIVRWHVSHSGSNWAVATSPDRGAFDIDVKTEEDGRVVDGEETLARLQSEHGAKGGIVASPVTVRTGTGRQIYLSFPDETPSTIEFMPGLDTRVTAGYAIIPPSTHRTGRRYEWCLEDGGKSPWDVERLPPAPEWLVRLIHEAKGRPKAKKATATPEVAGPDPVAATFTPITRLRVKAAAPDLRTHPGADKSKDEKRHPILWELIGRHLNRGEQPEDLEPLVTDWAKRCSPPMDEEEALETLWKFWEKDQKGESPSLHGRTANSQQPAGDGKEGTINEADAVVRPDAPVRDGTIPEARPSDPGPKDNSCLPGPDCDCDDVAACEDEGIPDIHPDAFHGLLGRITRDIASELEGRPEPVRFALLTAFGNAVGPGAWVDMGTAGRHRPNLFACLVAPSGIGKSEPWTVAEKLMSEADPDWFRRCIMAGLGSGEGLVDRVRDERTEQQPVKEKGAITGFKPVTVPGAADKRACVHEAEFGKILTLCRRDGSTLAQNLCRAWDGGKLEVANRGSNALQATGHLISIWGNITDAELEKRMADALEAVNGFGNRFLWLRQARVRKLAFGGNMAVLNAHHRVLSDALTKARRIGEVNWSPEARPLWSDAYDRLIDTQGEMPALGRARAHALRLALISALVDGSDTLKAVHVRAGLAAWDWSEASARSIFGGEDEGGGDEVAKVAGKVLKVIKANPGIKRQDLLRAVRVQADKLTAALIQLETKGLAHYRSIKNPKGGTAAECWWPGKPYVTKVDIEDVTNPSGPDEPMKENGSPASADRGLL